MPPVAEWLRINQPMQEIQSLGWEDPLEEEMATHSSITAWEIQRSHGEGNGNPLQHSCLGNHMDKGSWQATAHRVAELDKNEHT